MIPTHELIDQGAFLTVKSGKLLNTMTIRWSSEGLLWGQHCLTVMVSTSRCTHDLMVKDFTVSIPSPDLVGIEDKLHYCGHNSGRDVNKFKECGLGILPANKTETPILDLPGKHFECEIIYKHTINPMCLKNDEKYTHIYKTNGYHTFFMGEILDIREI